MTDIINETINAKEAVLFACNSMNELTRRFGEMLKYCAKNKLRIVNVFFGTQADQYKMIGNAVSPIFSKILAKALYKLLFQ